MFGTIFLFFFLTKKPFFQNLKFYLLLPHMGGRVRKGGVRSSFAGGAKKFSRALRHEFWTSGPLRPHFPSPDHFLQKFRIDSDLA